MNPYSKPLPVLLPLPPVMSKEQLAEMLFIPASPDYKRVKADEHNKFPRGRYTFDAAADRREDGMNEAREVIEQQKNQVENGQETP
jgi:hypothetical protein